MTDSTQIASPLLFTSVAAAAGVLSASALWAYSVFVPGCQFWAPVIRAIPQMDAVALTFDDGPHPEFTPQILDILAAHNISATFFVIGQSAKKHPAIIRRIVSEGHVLGNHSLDHDHFGVNRNLAYWHRQINDTQSILADITGTPPLLFRPPMGFKTRHIARAAKDARLPIIGWSLRTCDTRIIPPERIVQRTLGRLRGNDIVLMHDGLEPAREGLSQEHTVRALPAIIAGLQKKRLAAVNLIAALVGDVEAREGAPA